MIRPIAALACLLVVASCTSSGDSSAGTQAPPEPTSIVVVGAQSAPEATSVAAIAANPVLARFDCADNDRWKGGEDLQVFFEGGTDRAAIDELLTGWDQSDLVQRSEYFDRETSFDQFNEYWAQLSDDPPAVEVSIDDVPTRVALSIAAPVDENIAALLRPIEDDPSIFEIVERPVFCPVSADDMFVLCTELDLPRKASLFLEPSAPDSEIRRLGSRLEAIDGFESIMFVSQEQAVADFKAMLDDPTIDASWLDETPPHWNFTVPIDFDVTALFDELKQDPFVLDATAGGFCNPSEWRS